MDLDLSDKMAVSFFRRWTAPATIGSFAYWFQAEINRLCALLGYFTRDDFDW